MFKKAKQLTIWGDDGENMDLEERNGLSRSSSLLNRSNSKIAETTCFSNNSIIVIPKMSLGEEKIITKTKRDKNETPPREKQINRKDIIAFEMNRKKQLEKFDKLLKIISTSWFICAASLTFVSIYGYLTPKQTTGYKCLTCPAGYYYNSISLTCQIGCTTNQYWNGTICLNYFSYNNETCTNTSQCISPMICNLNLNVSSCNCPSNFTYNKCDCPWPVYNAEYYWNGSYCISANSYNRSCSATYQCQALTQSTSCISSKCACLSTQYFSNIDNKCEALLTINNTCTQIDACNSALGLSCQSSICSCNLNQFWQSTSCINYYSYNSGICTNTNQCQTSLFCKNATSSSCNCPTTISNGFCDCPAPVINAEYYWNGSYCISANSYNQSCSASYQCQVLTQNTYCNVTSCQCAPLQYFNTNQSMCINQRLINESCILTSDCRTGLGLKCYSVLCQCNSTNKFWNGGSCVLYFTYNNQTCSSSSQCASPLVCFQSGTSCNCPTSISLNTCDCPRSFSNEYYWSGVTCVAAASYNQSCTIGSNYTCQTLTQGTVCDSSTSKCICDPLYGRWNSSVCLFCPSNWVLLRNSCFIGSSVSTVFSTLSSALITSYCFNQPSQIARLINTDSQLTFFLTNTIAFPISLYYFNSYRIGATQTFQSGSNVLNVVSPYWHHTASYNCTIFDTSTNLYFYDFPCDSSGYFMCEYVLL